MKLDLEHIKRIARDFQEQYREDGGEAAYWAGRHVFTIEFVPETGKTRIHMAWPLFRNLVANEADGPTKISRTEAAHRLFLECSVQGIECVAIISDDMLQAEYATLGLPQHTYNDMLQSFKEWQTITAWNINWT